MTRIVSIVGSNYHPVLLVFTFGFVEKKYIIRAQRLVKSQWVLVDQNCRKSVMIQNSYERLDCYGPSGLYR